MVSVDVQAWNEPPTHPFRIFTVMPRHLNPLMYHEGPVSWFILPPTELIMPVTC